jgi:hypothetical protein
MARRWTPEEENLYRNQLREFYVVQNKTIFEVATVLGIKWQTVFWRLQRLHIPITPDKKIYYLGKRLDAKVPEEYSDDLAEFFGVMLGDGHLAHFQVTVALGTKEMSYAKYLVKLIEKIFGPHPKISIRKDRYKVVYFGSVDIVRWLEKEGLVSNKVKAQVDVPRWIFGRASYSTRFLRGFFDTDGSVYRLRYGIQISFTNASAPMLKSLQQLCVALGYRVSEISGWHFYITKISDVERFFKEVAPHNKKHVERFAAFHSAYKTLRAGRPVGGGG